MNITEAKALVLQECQREKKITIRNLVVVAVLVLIVVVLVVLYALPFVTQFASNLASSANENQPFYYKLIIPLVIVMSLYYPVMRTWTVFNRRKKVDEFFAQLEQGAEARIHNEIESYLTVIPLGKIKFQMDAVTLLQVSIGSKNYELPIYKYAAADVKRALSAPQGSETYDQVMKELFNKEATTATSAATTTNEPPITLKPVEEFRHYAQEHLATDLTAMEQGRSTSKNMLYIQMAFAIGIVALVFFLFSSGVFSTGNSTSVFILIGGFVGVTFLWSMFSKRYAQNKMAGTGDYTQVKSKVFGKLVHYISDNFQYFEKGHVNIGEFLSSYLFKVERYNITGGDQIVGRYNGVPFQSCNLSVTYRPNLRNEKEGDDVAFYGNFFMARSPKTFEHPIVIHPKKSFWGDMKDNEISTYLNIGGEKIRLEDPEFQKLFEVYCDDQITARYVLTPAFMERLKKLNEKHKGEVYIGINNDNIVIATNRGNALMKTDYSPTAMLFQKIDLAMVEDVYSELVAQLQMIDTLKLADNK